MDTLLYQDYDFRVPFHGSLTNLHVAESNGYVLLIKAGSLEHAEKVSTNQCLTVGSALRRFGLSRIHSQPQIRVIQRNRILQSGFMDVEIRKELPNLKL